MYGVKVTYEDVKKDYLKESEKLLNILRSVDVKSKDMDIKDIKWSYMFSFYRKNFSDKYYDELYKLKYDERVEEELSKIRVTLQLTAGGFSISDRVRSKEIPNSVRRAVNEITLQKIIAEQSFIGDDEIMNSLPIKEISEESNAPKTLDEQLQEAIENEDYIEAARLRDILRQTQNN